MSHNNEQIIKNVLFLFFHFPLEYLHLYFLFLKDLQMYVLFVVIGRNLTELHLFGINRVCKVNFEKNRVEVS